MPLPAIPLAAGALSLAGGWIGRALLGATVVSVLRGIAGLILRQLAIKTIFISILVGLWAFVLSNSQDLFLWFIDTAFSMLDFAMVALNFPDVFLAASNAINSLPGNNVSLFATLGLFRSIEFLLSCLFANRALRSVPIMGKAFGG